MATDKMTLDVYLAELKFVHDQMHTRMRVASRLVNVSAAFFSLLVTSYILQFDDIIDDKHELPIGIALILSFWGLAMLIAREDFLMINHDSYFFKKLRPAILNASGADSSDLTFLRGMSDDKIGGIITSFMSATRYLFPILGLMALAARSLMISPRSNYLAAAAFAAIITIALTMIAINNRKDKVDREANC